MSFMDINDIVASIPDLIASLYDTIFVVNKSLDKCYRVQYTVDKLKVSKPTTYDEFTKYMSVFKDNVLDEIEKETRDIKKVIISNTEEKLLASITHEEYKIVLLSSLRELEIKENINRTIIIADDSPVITKFFTKTFENEFNILVAKDGNEAIELVEANKDSNLLGLFVDLQMPVKNGYEVLDYFKENNLFSLVPVSVISGEDTADGIERATNYGIVDMLQKPFSADAARAIVNKTISFSPKNN